MSTKKDFTLAGIGPDVQFGKGGGRFVWNTDHWEATSDGTTLVQIRIPTAPTNNNDAASKSYVDSVASGLDSKESVRVASTANIGALSGLLTIDGITLVAGDRVLVKNQTTTTENGIYVAAVGAWTRSTDADAAGELSGGSFVFVESGTVAQDTGWVVSADGPLTPGTDAITWAQFSSAGIVTAGTGLTKTGNVINANVGATTITVNGSDDLILNSSATANQILLSAGTAGTEASWGALPLGNTSAVTGLLGLVNGGLNTNITAFADESLFVMSNTNGNVNELAAGTNGNALIMSAGAVAWGTISLNDNTNAVTGTLGATNGGTGLATYVQGDIIVASAANTLSALALGTATQVLQSDGTNAVWGVVPSAPGTIDTIVAAITYNGGATQLIGSVPAGGRVVKVSVDVGTGWNVTETVEIGDSGQIDRLMVATANDPEGVALYSTDLNNLYAGATTVNATVTNANTPSTGAATVIVQYIAP